jgi:hypothetical protein
MVDAVRVEGAVGVDCFVQVLPSKVHVSFRYPLALNPPNRTTFLLIGSYVIADPLLAEGEFEVDSFDQVTAGPDAIAAVARDRTSKRERETTLSLYIISGNILLGRTRNSTTRVLLKTERKPHKHCGKHLSNKTQ